MDLNVINDYEILNATLSKVVNPSKGTVEIGGLFKPSTCRAKTKVCKNVGQISVIYRHLNKIKLFQVSNSTNFLSNSYQHHFYCHKIIPRKIQRLILIL